MTKLKSFAAAVALSLGALLFGVAPSSAMPLAGTTDALVKTSGGLVEKTHGFHCAWRRGHRHLRACPRFRRHHRVRRGPVHRRGRVHNRRRHRR
ncbi:MAG: hypothetical protein KDJ36_04255 [Hyphomicrobiaceae bacterium]|nr:hypothetical protein [Hyphomicrobiaceae bacterium]